MEKVKKKPKPCRGRLGGAGERGFGFVKNVIDFFISPKYISIPLILVCLIYEIESPSNPSPKS